MSMSFDPTKGMVSGFRLYFVIPLLLSWILLWVEGADHSKPWMRYAGMVETGDPAASQKIDDVVYGQKD